MTTRDGITEEQWGWAEVVWDHHLVHHERRPCDAAIALGSHDLDVAGFAAELYHAGLFPTLVFTGGNSPATLERFPRGEAVHYREHAVTLGVPESAILLEPDAADTGEKIAFAQRVLADAGITPRRVMVVSMPYMERRAFATTRKVWPEAEVVCTSRPVPLREYAEDMGDSGLVIDMLVGDLQRVIEYPARGFAIEQEVSAQVLEAYEALLAAGFDGWVC